MSNLAVKYRPREFRDVLSQDSVVKILEKQIETGTFSNCLIFSGASGCGKTTLARIFANKVNNGLGEPIEIDAASNNSVDNVRMIVDSAIERSLDSKYKVFILDEAHMITTAGWNAFLKCIEEPPTYTLFIFCTTDPHKIPVTISNRCQIFKINRVKVEDIKNRLLYICNEEGFKALDGVDYISKISNGSLRQAISYLDKCKDYSTEITLNNAIECLGNYSYDVFFKLTNFIIDGDNVNVIECIEDLYNSGTDLSMFIDNYFSFILQILKYIIFNNIELTTIPASLENDVKYVVNIDEPFNWFSSYLNKILDIKKSIKFDNDMKTTIEVMLICK